jgi:hypothetical protein
LRVQVCLGPGVEFLAGGEEILHECCVADGDAAVGGDPWGAAALWLVGEVDGVALGEEVGGPSCTSVWGVEPVLFGLR